MTDDTAAIGGSATKIMGILNVSPDSFSGDGVSDASDALDQVARFLHAGASIIDIGAESTRPGAAPVAPADEIARLHPVMQQIRALFPQVPISLDTRHASTVVAMLPYGLGYVNDISAGKHDAAMLATVAKAGVRYVAMSNGNYSQDAQFDGQSWNAPTRGNIIDAVIADLTDSIERTKQAGIPANHLILDPGIGFGRSVEDNLAIVASIDAFADLGYPVMLAASRKSFIRRSLLDDSAAATHAHAETWVGAGSLAVSLYGYAKGVSIIRTHDVEALSAALRMQHLLRQPPINWQAN